MRLASVLGTFLLTTALAGMAQPAGPVVVVSNKNLQESRQAAAAAMAVLKARGVPAQVVELDGGAGDVKTLATARALSPRAVVTLGAFATRKAVQALPGIPCAFALVPFPETEGFPEGAPLRGVSPLDLDRTLFRAAAALTRERRVALVYSEAVAASAPGFLGRLRAAGFEAEGFPVSEAPLLVEVVRELGERFRVVVLLPDPLTENPQALRFLVTECLRRGILTLAASQELVERGVAVGASPVPEESGRQAAALVWESAPTAGGGPVNALTPRESQWAVNAASLRALGLRPTQTPDRIVQ